MRPFLFALPLLAVACAGHAASRDFPVGGFDKIELAGPYTVHVATGGRPAAHAAGSDRALERLLIEVRQGTLYIGTKPGGMPWWPDMGKVVIDVAAPPLRAARLTGSGDLTIDRARGPAFDLAVTGSGDATLAAVEVGRLAVSMVGSGDATAIGRAQAVSAQLRGSGDIHGGKLVAREATVSLTGSGDIDLTATGAATVSLTGSGDVTVRGGARCTVAKHGSGDVNCG